LGFLLPARLEAGLMLLPAVNRLLGDAGLPDEIRHLQAELRLLEGCHDLLNR